jgi:hypothetical protein
VAGAAEERQVSAVRLLDPRFRYVPANETDVTATWRRYGFDARQNVERRARVAQRFDGVRAPGEAAAIHPLLRKRA